METSDPGRCKARVVVGGSGAPPPVFDARRSLRPPCIVAAATNSHPTRTQHVIWRFLPETRKCRIQYFRIRLSESAAFKIRPKVARYMINRVALALGILRM